MQVMVGQPGMRLPWRTSRFELPGDGLLAARVCLDQRMPAGDPSRLRSAARRSGGLGRGPAPGRRDAAVLHRYPVWSGAAHRAFVEQIRAHAPSMSATADRYEHYASALIAYAGALEVTAPGCWLPATSCGSDTTSSPPR